MKLKVHFTEGRCLVHQAGPLVELYEVGGQHFPEQSCRAAVLELDLFVAVSTVVVFERGFVAPSYELLTLELTLDRKLLTDLVRDRLSQSGGHDELSIAMAHHDVVHLRFHGSVHVGQERPGGRRPNEKRRIGLVE